LIRASIAIAIIFCAALSLSQFVVAPVSAQSSSGIATSVSLPVNLSNDTGTAEYPNVQSIGSHVYVAWTEGSGGIKFRRSLDGGSHWFPSRQVPAQTISPLGGIAQYPMVSVNGSYVYVVWSQSLQSSGVQLLFAASSNFGLNFSSPVEISPTYSSDNYITPVIVSQGSNVYIGYLDNQCDCSYVISSSNYGASWSSPASIGNAHEPQLYAWGQYVYAVSDGGLFYSNYYGQSWSRSYVGGCCGSEPWIWGYGSNVYVAWETKGSGSQIYVASSNDNGASWNGPNFLTSTLPDSWAPMVWAHGSSAWIAERQYPSGKTGTVWVYTTTNGGSTWNSPISLSGVGKGGSAETFPYTVASSNGANVFVAWSHQMKPGHWTLMVSNSSDGGNTWSAPPGINISKNKYGEAGFETDIATAAISASGSTCYAVWEYVNGTTSQTYFAAV
jgi:hypothetical protein